MIEMKDLKLPLVIGITGHRVISSEYKSILNDKLKEIYKSLKKQYPGTPIILLSPLADGADRMAAKMAFEEKDISVCVPLPFDEKNYKDTFGKGVPCVTESDSINEYEDLIGKVIAQQNEFLPKKIPMLFDQKQYDDLDSTVDEVIYQKIIRQYSNLPKTINEAKVESGKKSLNEYVRQQIRRYQYSLVGEYIAIHSHILIAIYDDETQEKPGGTKEIVRKKLTGEYEFIHDASEDVTYPENGIVYAISTNSKTTGRIEKKYSVTQKEGRVYNQNKLITTRKKSIYTLIKKLCFNSSYNFSENEFQIKKIHEFNIEVDKHSKKIKEKVNKDIQFIRKKIYENYCVQTINYKLLQKDIGIRRSSACLVDNIYKPLQEKRKEKEKNIIQITNYKLLQKNIGIRRSAAYLADNIYKPLQEKKEKTILNLLAMTVFIGTMKGNIPLPYAYYFNIAFYLLSIVLIYCEIKKFKKIKEKQEDYRSLAEGLRIQTAWKMASINESVASYYLTHQRSSLNWIRTTIRSVNIFYKPKQNHNPANWINDYWVDSQLEYFFNKLSIKNHVTKEWIIQLIVAGLFVALILLGYVNLYVSVHKDTFLSQYLGLIQVFLIGLSLIALAYLKGLLPMKLVCLRLKQYFHVKDKALNVSPLEIKELNMNCAIYILVSILFISTIVFTTLHLYMIEHDKLIIPYLGLLKFIFIVLPLTALAYLKPKQLFDGNSELLKEYRLSYDIFSRAKKLLADPKNNKQAIYKNLGIEALRENSNWIMTRRTKQYKTPLK